LISDFRRDLNVLCFLLGFFLRIKFSCQSFGTICLFNLHRRVGTKCHRGCEICGAEPGMESKSNSFSGGVVAGSKNRLWRRSTLSPPNSTLNLGHFVGHWPPQQILATCYYPTRETIRFHTWFCTANFTTAVTLCTHSPMKMEQIVPKRWQLNFVRRKTYDKCKAHPTPCH
jgi:hypothetical protein